MFLVVDDYGLETVQEYMYHIRANAENSVRNLLVEVAKRAGCNVLTAVDYLDDGTPVNVFVVFLVRHDLTILYQIQLRVEINEEIRSAVLDFEGTGCEVRGNLNAPISVVHSAVIYCIRAMLDVDIPLNAGCLVPLDGAYILFAKENALIRKVNSQNPGEIVVVAFSDRCCLWRKCPYVPANC